MKKLLSKFNRMMMKEAETQAKSYYKNNKKFFI